jgi:hypothetical protein
MPDNRKKLQKLWEDTARKALEGKTITRVRYMTDDEAKGIGWGYQGRAVMLILDDGSMVLPSVDPEGNGPGALFTNIPGAETLPALP